MAVFIFSCVNTSGCNAGITSWVNINFLCKLHSAIREASLIMESLGKNLKDKRDNYVDIFRISSRQNVQVSR